MTCATLRDGVAGKLCARGPVRQARPGDPAAGRREMRRSPQPTIPGVVVSGRGTASTPITGRATTRRREERVGARSRMVPRPGVG
jgi:hypothetical protein